VRDRLHAFIDALRASGLQSTAAETLDAMHAVAALGVERQAMREGLASTLVKDHADRPLFDQVFDRFFSVPGGQRGKGLRAQPTAEGGGVGSGSGSGESARPREPSELTEPGPTAPVPNARPDTSLPHARTDVEAGLRLAQVRLLKTTPFAQMSPDQVEACDALVSDLSQRFRAYWERRQRAARRGRLDVRRTLRRAISKGGVPIDPAFRERRPGRPDLVALCDHSYSVSTATRFLLSLLVPASCFFRRVHFFAYVDEPVEVTLENGLWVPHDRLDLHARSDFGRVLRTFAERYHRILNRNTLLLILGDARNNRRPPRADVLARLRVSTRKIIWLNPEVSGRWNTGDSVMATYARECDAILEAANLQLLSSALKRAFRRP